MNTLAFIQVTAVFLNLLSRGLVGSAPLAGSLSSDSQLHSVDPCHPCGDVSVQLGKEVLKARFLKLLWDEMRNVASALSNVTKEFKIPKSNSAFFDLMEPCGYHDYFQHNGGRSQMNKVETMVNVMLTLKDIIVLNQTPLLDAANVRNMNSALCALHSLDAKKYSVVNDCQRLSPMDTECKRDFSKDKLMTLGFLKGVLLTINSLIRQPF